MKSQVSQITNRCQNLGPNVDGFKRASVHFGTLVAGTYGIRKLVTEPTSCAARIAIQCRCLSFYIQTRRRRMMWAWKPQRCGVLDLVHAGEATFGVSITAGTAMLPAFLLGALLGSPVRQIVPRHWRRPHTPAPSVGARETDIDTAHLDQMPCRRASVAG